MARKLRIQFPGALYHLVSRGNRRESIFRDDEDRHSFVRTLGDACAKTGWKVHAYCLLPDHFHLALETPEPNLVTGMKWFLGTYTARFNRRHKQSGHVFAGRYKSLLIGPMGGYLRSVCDYVHLNPSRAKLVADDSPLDTYPWSSFTFFTQTPEKRPDWMGITRVFLDAGLDDNVEGRERLRAEIEALRHQDLTTSFKPIRRGWCIGDPTFRAELLSQVAAKAGENHFGSELQEAAEARASRIIDDELRALLWTSADLLRKRKGDPTKIAIARRIRSETTVTLQWIAARLHMGTKTHLSHLLYWDRRADAGGGTRTKVRTSRTVDETKMPDPAKPETEIRTDQNNTLLRPDPIAFDPSFD